MKIDQLPCIERQEALIKRFSALSDERNRYNLLIQMGRDLALTTQKNLIQPQYLVKGCQSEVYLRTSFMDQKIFFECYTEALISAGLVALLFDIYQGEHP